VQVVTAAPRLTDRFRAENVPVTQIPGRNTGPREVWALLKVLRSLAVEAVVVDTPRDLRLAGWATLLHPAKVVYRYNLNYRRPRNHLADRMYARRVSACIFQSLFIQQEALRQERWVRRVRHYRVANGYDTNRFAPHPAAGEAFRRAWQIPATAMLVLTAAKLERHKGQEVAIAALDQIRGQPHEIVYVMCGDGARDRELRSLASDYKLAVRFTGLLDTDTLVAALSAADLVIHPSLREIFPNAVGEAMSCGRVVLAADAGGTAELLGRDGTTGVLVPASDTAAMATAARDLLNDTARRNRIGAAARRRIQAEFSLDRMIDGYEEALEQVIGQP
jgi:glycosyltransferase involved in cell wall biosynthesis